MSPPVEAKPFNGLFPMRADTKHSPESDSGINSKGNLMHLSVQEDGAPFKATKSLRIAEGGKS